MDKLKLRSEMKKKKPNFVRQDPKLKKFDDKWRRPRGLQSKLRKNQAGHIKTPSPGYRSPIEVRGLDPKGLKPKLIHTLQDLESVNKDESAIISSKVGLRKKLTLLAKAKELKLNISNVPNIEEFIKKSKENLAKRKEVSNKKQQEKQKARKETEKSEEKKAPEKKPEEPVKKTEDKK